MKKEKVEVNWFIEKSKNRFWCFRGSDFENALVFPLDMADELRCQHDQTYQEIAVTMIRMQEEECDET